MDSQLHKALQSCVLASSSCSLQLENVPFWVFVRNGSSFTQSPAMCEPGQARRNCFPWHWRREPINQIPPCLLYKYHWGEGNEHHLESLVCAVQEEAAEEHYKSLAREEGFNWKLWKCIQTTPSFCRWG